MSEPVILWRIYYGDRSTFDSTMGGPEDAPGTNVQHIVCRDTRPGHDPHNIGRYIVSGKYAYWRDEGQWWGGDKFGMWDYLVRPGLKIVKFGRSIMDDRWHETYRRAHDDPDFPPKSAYTKDEYHPSRGAAQDEVST